MEQLGTTRIQLKERGDAIKKLKSCNDAVETNFDRQAKTLLWAKDECMEFHQALNNCHQQVDTLRTQKRTMEAESHELHNEILALKNRLEHAEYKVITTCNIIFELAY